MKQFISVKDISDPLGLALSGLLLKQNPYLDKNLGKNQCLGLVFLNPSLRTRMSTQRAAQNLGLDCMILNIDKEGWALELKDGIVMDGTKVEHIREAASVMGEYCEILGLRSFAGLRSMEEDYAEEILNGFIRYSKVPVISLESALGHPLQSLADLMTILEHYPLNEMERKGPPKVTLLWAPHIKALPQAVPNSFSEWMLKSGFDLTICSPEGFELDPQYTRGAHLSSSKKESIQNADFIYVKNWSSYSPYGKIGMGLNDWMLRLEEIKNLKPGVKIMHCLPVRRGLELDPEILDSKYAIVREQGKNRVYSAQIVLKLVLQEINRAKNL